MAWTSMVNHTIFYIFELNIILSILHIVAFKYTLVLFSLCFSGQAGSWGNAAPV